MMALQLHDISLLCNISAGIIILYTIVNHLFYYTLLYYTFQENAQ